MLELLSNRSHMWKTFSSHRSLLQEYSTSPLARSRISCLENASSSWHICITCCVDSGFDTSVLLHTTSWPAFCLIAQSTRPRCLPQPGRCCEGATCCQRDRELSACMAARCECCAAGPAGARAARCVVSERWGEVARRGVVREVGEPMGVVTYK
jgi:hypothetical protein